MAIYETDPLGDPRWRALVEFHPLSSVFHTPEWLEALRRTYGYTAKVFTTNAPGIPLTTGMVFCQVDSWLTGSRLVSLPFSDHCDPLVQSPEDLRALLSEVRDRTFGRLKYAEIRPRYAESSAVSDLHADSQYFLHALDLHPSIEELHSSFHKDGMQRKIRRADREHVVLRQGQSELHLRQFYGLLLLTRRRHRLPPQSFTWFRNLADCFGAKLRIRLAYAQDRPIAGMLTLDHKQTIVYKYGCSDDRFHSFGGMPRLFWQTIREAKSDHFSEFDLGRSEQSNIGLIRFKDHLGATKVPLTYWRFRPLSARPQLIPQFGLAQSVLAHLPESLFRMAGKIFYRHAG